MLADDIAAGSGGLNDLIYGGAFTEFSKLIAGAQRFDLAPEVMRSALTISDSAIGSQLRALPLCRLPFADTWFEWPATFSGREPRPRAEIAAPVPKRMGALVRCIDDTLQRGVIVYAWSHAETVDGLGGLNLCPLVITFDWREAPEPVPDLANAATWHQGASADAWAALRSNFQRIRVSARADVIEDNQRFGVQVNRLMLPFIDRATEAGHLRLLIQSALTDIEGEPPLLRAAIMLMNAKNLATHEPRPVPAKLNAARIKRGRRPLLDHTHVGIRLSPALAARAGAAADAREPTRLHLVRGHFKLRRTGVFWWSPYPRGTPDGPAPIKTQHRHVTV